MNASDAQQLWTAFWNCETDSFWIGTVAEAALSGMSRFRGKATLKKHDQFKDEDRAKIIESHRWIFLGLFDTDRDAGNFVFELGNQTSH